jgi:aspartate aminotransferase-like enzyme
VVCIGGGKFGERMMEIVKSYKGIVKEVKVKWGKDVDPKSVEDVLSQSDAKAITLTHNETSTGVIHDAQAIGKIAREYDVLYIVDGTTSVGGDWAKVDEWGMDICIVGSQKCLAAPPGLVLLSISKKAWDVIFENDTNNFYLDLSRYKNALEKNTTPFTPSVPLIFGLARALKAIREEGLKNRIRRHRKIARAVRESMKCIGLELFPEEKSASNTLTAIKPPPGIAADEIRKKMKKLGILLAGGQGILKGKIFRIGHMGNVNKMDILSVISCLELVLNGKGKGIEKALEILNEK